MASTAGAPMQRRQPPRHRLDADVVGDVALELLRRQAEIAILLRQVALGVVGDQHQSAVAGALDDFEWSE